MNGVAVFPAEYCRSVIAGLAIRVLYDGHKKRQEEKASIGFEQLSDPVVKRYLEVTK